MIEKSSLESELEKFDGVAVSILSEARVKCAGSPQYFDELVRLSFDPRETISAGATWIIKAELEEGADLKPNQIQEIASSVNIEMPWQSMLHLCQSIECIHLTEEQADRFFKWAHSLSDHTRPFLRAWSLHVLVYVAMNYDRYRKVAVLELKKAEEDKAASVRARVRKLQKLLN